MRIPWLWTRRQIATRWFCKPQDVDEAAWFDVQVELQLMKIEAEATEHRKRHGG